MAEAKAARPANKVQSGEQVNASQKEQAIANKSTSNGCFRFTVPPPPSMDCIQHMQNGRRIEHLHYDAR